MRHLYDLRRLVAANSKQVEFDTSAFDQEQLDSLNQKVTSIQTEKLILDLEKTRMDMVLHVTEANNRRCEFWKEALEMTNNNYNLAIKQHKDKLETFEKEIKELRQLKENYKSVINQSQVERRSYLDGMRHIEESQANASEFFYHSESMIQESGIIAEQRLEEIDRDALEMSLDRMKYYKRIEEETKDEMIKLGVLRAKAEYLEIKTGISGTKRNYHESIREISEKLNKLKDSKERLEALKSYKKALETTLTNLNNQKSLNPGALAEQPVTPITASSVEELKSRVTISQHSVDKRGNIC